MTLTTLKQIENKLWRQNNKERMAQYRIDNAKKIKEYYDYYKHTPQEKKRTTLNNWARRGLKIDDVCALYDQYIQVTHCDECSVEFGVKGDGTSTFKCLDHCHKTGEFRNFLCNTCNVIRK